MTRIVGYNMVAVSSAASRTPPRGRRCPVSSPDPFDDPTTHVLLRALVALAVDEREAVLEKASGRRKTELLLSNAGLNARQIAALLDKKEGAVAKAVLRARKAQDDARGIGGNDD